MPEILLLRGYSRNTIHDLKEEHVHVLHRSFDFILSLDRECWDGIGNWMVEGHLNKLERYLQLVESS